MGDNCENTIRAGRITGNPLNGLCERVCIEVPVVYDGCIARSASVAFQLVLTDITPGMIYPYSFVSAVGYGDATFENLTVTPQDGNRARIRGDVVIPVVVTFTDATGRVGTGRSSVSVHKDVILRIPTRSLVPYKITVTANLASEIGNFINETTVNILCCIVTVIKVVVISDILVPTYGYSVYPDCTDGSEDLCTALLNLPVFPPFNNT